MRNTETRPYTQTDAYDGLSALLCCPWEGTLRPDDRRSFADSTAHAEGRLVEPELHASSVAISAMTMTPSLSRRMNRSSLTRAGSCTHRVSASGSEPIPIRLGTARIRRRFVGG